MKERRRLSAEWYRKNIFSMSDHEPLIGPIEAPDEEKAPAADLPFAFGRLLRLQRRQKDLTIAQLAIKLNVDEDEIRLIEHDPAFRAKPRLLNAISTFFEIPVNSLAMLAGVAATNDAQFKQQAIRFAAHSDDMGSLTRDEKELLKEFISFLRDDKK